MENISFLCGGFSLKAGCRASLASLLPSDWEAVELDSAAIHNYGQYYLPDFVDFHFGGNKDYSVRRFRHAVGKSLTLSAERAHTAADIPFSVEELGFYAFPFDLAMFSIKVRLSTDDANDVTALAAVLRNVGRLDDPALKGFIDAVLSPLRLVWERTSAAAGAGKAFDWASLVEDGNKFNLFQIVDLDGKTDGAASDKACTEGISDRLLFELGTVAPVSKPGSPESIYGPSKDYFKRIIAGNTLSVFANWKCLSLADTLTLLSVDTPSWLMENWCSDYFGMIYLYQLYCRNYFFRLTRRFRYEREDTAALEKECVEFERNCIFQRISYNFLPEEFNAALMRGLGPDRDKEVLYHMIEQEESKREKLSDDKMNRLLFFMTCLTMASAIYDACCLLDVLAPFGDGSSSAQVLGFRLITGLLVTVLLVALLMTRRKNKR